MITASPGFIAFVNTAFIASSSLSNGLAFNIALCISFGTAECLTTAPFGAKLPPSIAIAPLSPIGFIFLRITSSLFNPTSSKYLLHFS